MLTVLIGVSLYAKKILVNGEAEYLIRDNRLMKQYEYEVLQLAINNALYNAFGSSVVSNYERLSNTQMEGRSLLNNSEIRSSYISSYPNGVWRGNKEEPKYSTYKDKKGNWWIKCTVNGYAEEMFSKPVEFTARTLDGTDIVKDETINFISGESGYLYFRSATNGYLTIFYDDFKNVQRCIPYNRSPESLILIKANKDYLFFSPEKADYISNANLIDEIEFITDKQIEYNQFYIVFSPTQISLPVLEDETETTNNYSTFKTLERDKFHKWLQNSRLRNKELQIQIIGVTVKKIEKTY